MPAAGTNLLLVNAGSSSLRLTAWKLPMAALPSAEGHWSPAPEPTSEVLLDFLRSHGLAAPGLVVHRVVHGGKSLRSPSWLTPQVIAEVRRLRSLGPLHNTLALGWIEAAHRAFGPALRQAACFDTAFFSTLPEHSARYALPEQVAAAHEVLRYGFHGLAHESMVTQWRATARNGRDQRVISLQLGSGCSITASDCGRPLDTSMGFSPLEGLIMATRCGNLDPAAVLHLLDRTGMTTAQLSEILNRESGLLGVSGESSDMRTLLAAESPAAHLAVDMFCHRIRLCLGGYLAVLRGAKAIVFGGGIGENSPTVRQRVLEGFEWAGIEVDRRHNELVNASGPTPIHAGDSRVQIWVIPPNEAAVMAAQAESLLEAERNV